MTAIENRKSGRVEMVFHLDGDGTNGRTNLVYCRNVWGQHVIYDDEAKCGSALAVRFNRIEDARAEWKRRRASLESRGYVAVA